MDRVVAQGDLRPMAGNREAMADLQRILAGREAFYAKADLGVDTSGLTLAEAHAALTTALAGARASADAATSADAAMAAQAVTPTPD
jgi:XRE family aerobic/anaerobic benzoate catabolism transcriptional regulator